MPYLNTYKIPQDRGYSKKTYYIEDTTIDSPDYFVITDFPLIVGGGRYVIKLKGNGLNLRLNKSIDIEIKDASGNNIFCEVLKYIDRFNNYYVAFDVYDITAKGVATAYFVGEAQYDLDGKVVPAQHKDRHNVRWSKQFNVLPFERNNSELIFDSPPKVSLAQIVTPARILTQQTSSAYSYKFVTSSANLLQIVTSNFNGYDREFATSADILDSRLQGILANPTQAPTTINSVTTFRRELDDDIQNGYVINQTTRFNTRLVASQSFFTKQHLGGYFEFYDSQSVPRQLQPSLPTGFTVSGSLDEQVSRYTSNIVEVISDTQAILNKPLTITTINSAAINNPISSYTYKQSSLFTGSITYVPSSTTYVTSSTVSQSYLEITFSDLNPIGGEVYRIRTLARLGSLTGDYKVINDQKIFPVEYLTDAEYPNTENYTRYDSEYRMIGYFTSESILNNYWTVLRENPYGFDIVTGSLNNSVLIQSTTLPAAFTQSTVFTTAFNQNYNYNQTYTLSFYLTLDPYTEMEVYMNSDILNTYITAATPYPKAFIQTTNKEKTRYKQDQNRFGKYLGKIVNDRPTQRYYGKLLFDFETDSEGLGSPLFRSKIVNYKTNTTGSAYVSEVSIKPYALNGFTPNIVQYAVPLPQEYVEAAALSQSIDLKLEYLDYTGRQSEYATYLDDIVLNLKAEIVSNTCQTDKLSMTYNSSYL